MVNKSKHKIYFFWFIAGFLDRIRPQAAKFYSPFFKWITHSTGPQWLQWRSRSRFNATVSLTFSTPRNSKHWSLA